MATRINELLDVPAPVVTVAVVIVVDGVVIVVDDGVVPVLGGGPWGVTSIPVAVE